MRSANDLAGLHADAIAAVHLLACVYLRHARADKALALLEALDQVEPGNERILRALALAQELCDQHDDALRTLDRAGKAGTDASLQLLRARSLAASQRPLEASIAMSACLALKAAPVAAKVSA